MLSCFQHNFNKNNLVLWFAFNHFTFKIFGFFLVLYNFLCYNYIGPNTYNTPINKFEYIQIILITLFVQYPSWFLLFVPKMLKYIKMSNLYFFPQYTILFFINNNNFVSIILELHISIYYCQWINILYYFRWLLANSYNK